MNEILGGKRLLMASTSPRRRELMEALGLPFSIVAKQGVDESYPESVSKKDVAEYIAKKKASAYASDLTADDILLTADTIVLVDKEILGKPTDEASAIGMLGRLSGQTHKVITGVALTALSSQVSFSVKTKVTMRKLTAEQIDYYVRTYRPLDKAGAYGIQEWIGLVGIDYIEGSYHNVMGLPTQRLYAELASFVRSIEGK